MLCVIFQLTKIRIITVKERLENALSLLGLGALPDLLDAEVEQRLVVVEGGRVGDQDVAEKRGAAPPGGRDHRPDRPPPGLHQVVTQVRLRVFVGVVGQGTRDANPFPVDDVLDLFLPAEVPPPLCGRDGNATDGNSAAAAAAG